jgi:Arc/MetJ-type ribon-helix-helix transcriptional regulator
VREKIASGKYRSAEELVTEAVSRLIAEENAAPRDLSWLEKELQAGLNTPAREMTEADWEQLRQRIERKANASWGRRWPSCWSANRLGLISKNSAHFYRELPDGVEIVRGCMVPATSRTFWRTHEPQTWFETNSNLRAVGDSF